MIEATRENGSAGGSGVETLKENKNAYTGILSSGRPVRARLIEEIARAMSEIQGKELFSDEATLLFACTQELHHGREIEKVLQKLRGEYLSRDLPEKMERFERIVNPLEETEQVARPGVRRFRKKPVVIEAVQWTGENAEELFAFGYYLHAGLPDCPLNRVRPNWKSKDYLTVEGVTEYQQAAIGDWIVKNEANEYSVVSAEVFEATYEAAE